MNHIKYFERNTEGRDFIGKEYATNEGDIAIVVEYQNYENVFVTFKSKGLWSVFTLKCQLGDLRRGRVKNPWKIQHFGVGYKGVGRYVMAIDGKNTKSYQAWRNMLSRCYNPKDKEYQNYGSRGVVVCKEWYNFQIFAEWFEKNYKTGYSIDKDLINPGSKEYSSESCTMLPIDLNKFLGSSQVPKFWYNQEKGCFVVQGKREDNVNFIVGRYATKEKAIFAFIEYKKNRILYYINKYKDLLTTEVVELLETYPGRVHESY